MVASLLYLSNDIPQKFISHKHAHTHTQVVNNCYLSAEMCHVSKAIIMCVLFVCSLFLPYKMTNKRCDTVRQSNMLEWTCDDFLKKIKVSFSGVFDVFSRKLQPVTKQPIFLLYIRHSSVDRKPMKMSENVV